LGPPVKAAGTRQSVTEGVCPTPAVTGLTSAVEYLALAWFGSKSGAVKELAGWTPGEMATKTGLLYRNWTGITTTGEPAFTKTGKPVAMTTMVVVQPSESHSTSVTCGDTITTSSSAVVAASR
jgi:hypothetical protein